MLTAPKLQADKFVAETEMNKSVPSPHWMQNSSIETRLTNPNAMQLHIHDRWSEKDASLLLFLFEVVVSSIVLNENQLSIFSYFFRLANPQFKKNRSSF